MFWKTKNKYISGSTVWGFIQFVFIVCPGQGVAKYIEHKCWPLTYTANKAILKSKKWFGTTVPVSFSAWFLKKNVSHNILY